MLAFSHFYVVVLECDAAMLFFGCRFFLRFLFVVRLVERVASFNLLLVFLLQLLQPVVGD